MTSSPDGELAKAKLDAKIASIELIGAKIEKNNAQISLLEQQVASLELENEKMRIEANPEIGWLDFILLITSRNEPDDD